MVDVKLAALFLMMNSTNNQPICNQCGQREHCRAVYDRLCHSDAPNMTVPVLWGLVAPLAVFVVVCVVVWSALAHFGTTRWLTAVVFAAGFVSAWVTAIGISQIRRHKR